MFLVSGCFTGEDDKIWTFAHFCKASWADSEYTVLFILYTWDYITSVLLERLFWVERFTFNLFLCRLKKVDIWNIS